MITFGTFNITLFSLQASFMEAQIALYTLLDLPRFNNFAELLGTLTNRQTFRLSDLPKVSQQQSGGLGMKEKHSAPRDPASLAQIT